jgi:diadenosine tetraphosphate (Ap4A) HIT family hydrolase
MNCPFCNPDRKTIVANKYALAILDGFPVSQGHALVIPRRHVPTIFDLNTDEYTGCFALVREVKILLEDRHSTNAFNIGVNCGEVSGQTVDHAHIHVIPRYSGDVDDPRGGVRHVIPGKGFY